MSSDLPFIVEYAKSNRASCKECIQNIGKDSLRMGVMVQSPHFDGKIPVWHHSRCFFEKNHVSSVAEIANFHNLKFEDQKKIKEKIAEGSSNSKSKKGAPIDNADFSIEYAKSDQASCKTCSEKIYKCEIRISNIIRDTPEAQRFGPITDWRHVECFVKDRLELGYTDSADKLPGFNSLVGFHKNIILEILGHLGVKRKSEEESPEASKGRKLTREDKLLKAQSFLLFNMRDKIKSNLSKNEMIELLEYNNQHISVGEQHIRDNLSDCLIFGAIKTCPECKNGTPRFKLDAYRCPGNVTEWTKCQYFTKCPERGPFKIPEEFKEQYDFLKSYRYVQRNRIFPINDEASTSIKKGPLNGYTIAIFGIFSAGKTFIENSVQELDGAISEKVDQSVICCISTEQEVSYYSGNVKAARNLDIHIVSQKFLYDVKKGLSPAAAIKENTLCSWGGDPILKFGIKQEHAKSQAASFRSSSSSSSPSKSFASGSKTIKLTAKGGAAVDPDSGLESKAHVYQKKENIYNTVLGLVDLSRGTNTYYKMQVLESNTGHECWLFRASGRVGTTIGSNKIENFYDPDSAVEAFEKVFLEKTGNKWENRKNFVKQPEKFYPLDIDYGQDSKAMKDLKVTDDSKLHKSVQELICLIFDVKAMKKTMVDFEIDLKKMPLGKLSRQQIEKAYSVLCEAQEIINTGSNATKVLDASNRFYTLIPHDFGLKTPPLLDNEELIKLKIETLDSLMEIELAYRLMSETATKDPVLESYEKLKADIDILDEFSEEYEVINKYFKNTQHYCNLVLNKVFKINRHGEKDRYEKKCKKLRNKKLLWHGSRLTNFVGILSEGLRAPGYSYDKGVYFADMVSKSVNYCFMTNNTPGLLLLCEVALGNMHERTRVERFRQLPTGKHSTKDIGMTHPDPSEKTYLGDVEVPFGKPVQNHGSYRNGLLLYNEYIVYDVNQINIKYLLEVSRNTDKYRIGTDWTFGKWIW